MADRAKPRLSILIPTRERGRYVGHAIATCVANPGALEVVVLDNASTDETARVVADAAARDPRIRTVRSETRLSMRGNFERGLDEARGDVIGFIGDDDGVMPDTVHRVLAALADPSVDAVTAERIHYAWPDLLSARRNTMLIPRRAGMRIAQSRAGLANVLGDGNYYRTPCVYHGFVRRAVVDRIRARQGGSFFLSSQVDIYSAIALGMENIGFIHDRSPLVINGGSARSNGASHFGGGSTQEKHSWQSEDEVGFLPGFGDFATVQSLIIESAARYAEAHGIGMDSIFAPDQLAAAMSAERDARERQGKPIDKFDAALAIAGLGTGPLPAPARQSRLRRQIESLSRYRPVDAAADGVRDVAAAARLAAHYISTRRTGFTARPVAQLATALKIAFGRDVAVS